jgi:hypothetical protein
MMSGDLEGFEGASTTVLVAAATCDATGPVSVEDLVTHVACVVGGTFIVSLETVLECFCDAIEVKHKSFEILW